MSERRYTVDGMSCEHCVTSVSTEVSRVAGVRAVEVDLAGKAVTVRGDDFDDDAVRAAIDEAGYSAIAQGTTA